MPAAATASGEGREGLSECRYPSAAATHAHVTRPPARLPPGLPPAHPHSAAPPGPPDPRGCPLAHPIPRGSSRPTLTPAPGVSPGRPSHRPPALSPAHPHTDPQGFSLPFPTAARRCRGVASLSAAGFPPEVRSKTGNTQELPGGHRKTRVPCLAPAVLASCAKVRP